MGPSSTAGANVDAAPSAIFGATTVLREPVGTELSSTESDPHRVERELVELVRALDPMLSPASPQNAAGFTRALHLLDELPLHADGPVLAQCLVSMTRYAYVSGQELAGLAPAEKAVDLLRRLGLQPLLRIALSMRGTLLAETGNVPGAIESYAEALEIAAALRDPHGEAAVCNNLGIALIYAAQYDGAIACLQRAVRLSIEGERARHARGSALNNIALASLHLEEYGRGLQAAREAVALLDDFSTPFNCLTRVQGESFYARLLLEVDAPQTARQRCEIAKRIARESGFERAELCAGVAEGLCDVRSGAIDLGLSRLSKLLERARVLNGELAEVLIAVIKAHEMASRHDMALVYLRELMMHTKYVQQQSALLHHRLHLKQLEQGWLQPTPTTDALMARREEKLCSRLVQQVAHRELMKARVEMLDRISVVADMRAGSTGHHSFRVGKLAALLAQASGWDEDSVFLLELAARLHDIGKIGLPEQVLRARSQLADGEAELARSHAQIGAEILSQSDLQHLKMAEEIARFHHEHWDGSGYPFGLAYSAIPLPARITALADAYDELTHPPAHEPARSAAEALCEIAAQRSRHFDPELTDVFVQLVPRLPSYHGGLDDYLEKAACESPFVKAQQKIAATLKEFDGHRALRS